MAAAAVQSRTMMTEGELIQQKICDHLAKIDTAMERMADAMTTAAIGGGTNHQQIPENPPSYDVSTNADIDPERIRLQDPVHDRIDALERNYRTLQIAFGIAITAIAICYYYGEAAEIPWPILLVMLLAIIVGAVSRRN